jgi:hypothetical protein
MKCTRIDQSWRLLPLKSAEHWLRLRAKSPSQAAWNKKVKVTNAYIQIINLHQPELPHPAFEST